jgi:hypothetical protein
MFYRWRCFVWPDFIVHRLFVMAVADATCDETVTCVLTPKWILVASEQARIRTKTLLVPPPLLLSAILPAKAVGCLSIPASVAAALLQVLVYQAAEAAPCSTSDWSKTTRREASLLESVL